MTDAATPTPRPAPKKKKSLLGKLVRVFAVLFVLFAIGLVILYFNLNTLVSWGVTRGGKYATEQETALQEANLALFGGTLSLNNLAIDNIKDPAYKEPKFLVMKKCDTIVSQPMSVLSSTVVIDSISIDGLEIWLEQNGAKNNLNDLMAIIQKNSPAATPPAAGGGTSAAAPPDSPGKKLVITKLTLTNTKVHVRAAPLPNIDLDLPILTITDPTNPNGRPMKIADLISRILLNVCQQILDNPQLPGGLKANMKNVTALVDNMKGTLDKGLKDFSKDLGNLSKDPMKAVQDLGKDTKNLQGLQNLNPFAPKTQPK